METKMIRVPFSVELAKQITNGEKKGRIIMTDEREVRIMCFDMLDKKGRIVGLVKYNNEEIVCTFNENGSCIQNPYKMLCLEVPEYTQFKDGDVIAFATDERYIFIGIYKEYEPKQDTHIDYVCLTASNDLHFEEGGWLNVNIRYATEAEKQQLIDALKQSTDPRAKNCLKMLGIEEEKPKCEFKPFDKVLVRDSRYEKWHLAEFAYKDDDEEGYIYEVVGSNCWKYCIPYEDNEHLLGTTDNP